MKTILSDGELSEITIEDSIKSNDAAIVIKDGRDGTRGPNLPDLQKEIIAHDAIDIGPTRAAEIHGVSQSSASRYASGESLSEEAKTRVLDNKHQIRDLATTKLLQSLNLIDPTDIESKDLPRVASQLSQIVERLEDKGKGGPAVSLHLYAPIQKKIAAYEIIDV